MRVAVFIKRNPFDIFHDKIGKAALGHAAVEEAGNVGMIEVCQDLALIAEMPEHGISVHAAFDQFDSDTLFILLVGTLSQIDRAHAAAADLFNTIL